MDEWRRATLGELCAEAGGAIQTGPFGSQLHASDYVLRGVPVVMPQNIGDNRIDPNGIARVSRSDWSRLERHALRPGDIVYSRRGDVERRALVRDVNKGWLCGTGCLRVRIANQQIHDSRFVSYLLGLAETRKWIVRHAVGATMLNLNTTILANVPLLVPELREQQAIAEVLGALDDKIAANVRVVAAADALSRAWYRSVERGVSAPLSSLARFVNGKAFTKDATGTGRVVIRIAELNSGIGGSTVYNDLEVADDHRARPGDLLFAWSGSLTVARWFRPEAIVNQHIFKVVPMGGNPMWLVNQALRSKLDEFRAIAADKATTMGHIQRRHLDEPVELPQPGVVAGLDPAMGGLWDRALAAEIENERVAATRDELLPLLMSGRIRVKDATRVVEEVV